MDLNEAVKQCTRISLQGNEYIVWDDVMELVNPDDFTVFSKASVRSAWRRLNGHRNSGKPMITHEVMPEKYEKPVNKVEILKAKLKQPHSLSELVELTGLSDIEVLGHIGQLRNNGDEILDFKLDHDVIYVNTSNKVRMKPAEEVKHYHDVSRIIKFGVVSDTHMCSKYEQHTYLQMAYDDFQKENIQDVYHVGDITDGFYTNRPQHLYELHKLGFDQQKDYVIANYPKRDGIKTHVIAGNHDSTHIKNGGGDIVQAIANAREDFEYLGQSDAKVWLTDKIDMDLKHPDGGSSYAYSYRPQKIVESLPGGEKPKILLIGHYHKNFFMVYRNVIIMCIPSFVRQTPFMKGMALVSDVGYVIVEMRANENGDVIEFTPRFKMFYKMLSDDYVK